MPKSWGLTFVVLIPKKDLPKYVSSYLSISLCNVCYKIVAKTLANRLKFLPPNLIGVEQCGFIQGHSLVDKILVAQEVVHSMDREYEDPRMMLLKIDIAKVYDTVRLNTILATLSIMGFHLSRSLGLELVLLLFLTL